MSSEKDESSSGRGEEEEHNRAAAGAKGGDDDGRNESRRASSRDERRWTRRRQPKLRERCGFQFDTGRPRGGWRSEKNDLHRRRPAVRRGRRASDAIFQKRTRGRRVDETDRGREERMPQRLRVREI